MGYRERVPEELKKAGQRTAERTTLWQAIVESFEKEGADGVENELGRQIDEIGDKFDDVLDKLNGML